MSTGTLPTGLALLRILDPDLKGPVAGSTVLGATFAFLLAIPLLIVVMPVPVSGWPETFPGNTLIAIGTVAWLLISSFRRGRGGKRR